MKSVLCFLFSAVCLTLVANAQESWVAQNGGITSTFFSVDFVDTNMGWAVGNGIYRTNNGGTTWISSNPSIADQWFGVDFVNASVGYAVGFNGFIARTNDGGTTWTVGNLENNTTSLTSVDFVNASTGWAVGQNGSTPNIRGIVMKTIDSGKTWNSQSITNTYILHSVYFVDANTGWAVGDTALGTGGITSGVILKTTNGGSTWITQVSGPKYLYIKSVHFINANTGWAAGSKVLKTVDGGVTWASQATDTINGAIQALQFLDANNGFGVGGATDKAYRTNDGGATWKLQYQNGKSTDALNSVHFVDAIHGWAVGNAGLILKHTGSPVPILKSKSLKEGFGVSQTGQLNYRLAGPSRVLVSLFDGQGRKVLKLIDENQQPGDYHLSIPERWMPSPVFLEITTNDHRKTIPLVRK